MRCAVLGSPIEHSLSPTLHQTAYAELELDWRYEAIEVTAEGLPGFLAGLDGSWRGLSLTMPLKRVVVPLLDVCDDLVQATRVANTVILGEKEHRGANTDIPGAIAALRERGVNQVNSAVILGGGATATSLGWALADLGCRDLRFIVRSPSRMRDTLTVLERYPRRIRIEVVDNPGRDGGVGADVLVSTIPVSAQDAIVDGMLARNKTLDFGTFGTVFEVVYDPWPTPISTWAKDTGRVLIDGIDLLAHQAALQVTAMTGRAPNVDRMRESGWRMLRGRSET